MTSLIKHDFRLKIERRMYLKEKERCSKMRFLFSVVYFFDRFLSIILPCVGERSLKLSFRLNACRVTIFNKDD